MLNIGGLHIPYSVVSLVTLTVQNSALTILLHYVRPLCSSSKFTLTCWNSLARRRMRSRTLPLLPCCSMRS